MGSNTGIEWAHHTFNPWWGCVRVSPGCDHCYAERDAFRFAPKMKLWGPGSTRREFRDEHWHQPIKWANEAVKTLDSVRVFCASMADVLDKDGPAAARERLWETIEATPALDWLLLTKRIGNARRLLPKAWIKNGLPPQAWLGISVVNQEEADRDIPKLLEIPARIRWLSCEPLLGPVDLKQHMPKPLYHCSECGREKARNYCAKCGTSDNTATNQIIGVDWVIVGGESGPHARGMNLDWARSIVNQCEDAGVACFVKQLGARPFDTNPGNPIQHRELRPRHRKGGDPLEWPDELRVRQFPTIDFGDLPV